MKSKFKPGNLLFYVKYFIGKINYICKLNSKNFYDINENTLFIKNKCSVFLICNLIQSKLLCNLHVDNSYYGSLDECFYYLNTKIYFIEVCKYCRININYFPQSLKKINLYGYGYYNLKALPLKLTDLRIYIGHMYTYNDYDLSHLINLNSLRLDGHNSIICNIPFNLQSLIYYYNFNQSVDNLPINLKILLLNFSFNQTVDNLPSSLIVLKLDVLFKQSIDKLPNNLQILYLFVTYIIDNIKIHENYIINDFIYSVLNTISLCKHKRVNIEKLNVNTLDEYINKLIYHFKKKHYYLACSIHNRFNINTYNFLHNFYYDAIILINNSSSVIFQNKLIFLDMLIQQLYINHNIHVKIDVPDNYSLINLPSQTKAIVYY